MRNINRIITEVINNTVVFTELNDELTDLEYYYEALKKEQATSQDIAVFYKSLIVFVGQLIAAMTRCIQAKSLNEGLTNNNPSLTNLYNSMMSGLNSDILGDIYHNYRQFKRTYGNNGASNGNGGSYGGGQGTTNGGGQGATNTNTNTNGGNSQGNVKTLYALLTEDYPKMSQTFFALNRRYNNYFMTSFNSARNIMDIIENIIEIMQKAQGN